MATSFESQDNVRVKFLIGLFVVVQITALIVASIGALLGYEKVFFPFS